MQRIATLLGLSPKVMTPKAGSGFQRGETSSLRPYQQQDSNSCAMDLATNTAQEHQAADSAKPANNRQNNAADTARAALAEQPAYHGSARPVNAAQRRASGGVQAEQRRASGSAQLEQRRASSSLKPASADKRQSAGQAKQAAKQQTDTMPVVQTRSGHKRKRSVVTNKPADAPNAQRKQAGKAASSQNKKQHTVHRYADLVGKSVDVPGSVFKIDVPDLYYRGTVLKPDSTHKGAVVVHFDDDGSKYWFPVTDVRKWIDERGDASEVSGTTGAASDAFAAGVLAEALVAKHKQERGDTASSKRRSRKANALSPSTSGLDRLASAAGKGQPMTTRPSRRSRGTQ